MTSNMVDHMVAPLDDPIRLRTRLPATSVPSSATAAALLVAFAACVRNGNVKGLQLFSENIASLSEIE